MSLKLRRWFDWVLSPRKGKNRCYITASRILIRVLKIAKFWI